MAIRSENDAGSDAREECAIRIAATGDIHLGREGDAERWAAAFAGLRDRVDLDPARRRPDHARRARAGRDGRARPCATSTSRSWPCSATTTGTSTAATSSSPSLTEGGIDVLEREHRVLELCGAEVGIAGVKGFGGGFDGAHIPDFGEPLMRRVYAESMEEADGARRGAARDRAVPVPDRAAALRADHRDARGRAQDIWPFLGTDRLAAPLREHHPDLVLHGHAHAGTFEGQLGEVPVYNVSVPVLGEDFWVFEMTGARADASEVH